MSTRPVRVVPEPSGKVLAVQSVPATSASSSVTAPVPTGKMDTKSRRPPSAIGDRVVAGVYRLARPLLELAHVACYLVVNILNSNLTAGIAHNTQLARAWRSRYESRANRPGRPIVRQVEPKLTLSILEYEPALGVLYVAQGLPEACPCSHQRRIR